MANLLSIIDSMEDHFNITSADDSISQGSVCLKDLLSIEQDSSININKIYSMEYLYELGDPNNREELLYVESKIIKFLTIDAYDISECFDLYTFTQDLCKQGISYEILPLLGDLINLKVDTITDDDFKEDLKIVENRLGKYVPQIIEQIINFSEIYEKKNCAGQISNNTLIMKRLHTKLLNTIIPSIESDSFFDIDLGGFFKSFQSNIITKVILLIFIGYILSLFFKLFSIRYRIND